jgi:hypothetical protein
VTRSRRLPAPPPPSAIAFTGFGTLALGIAAVITYFTLQAHNVGKIGQPTDIGGGLIVIVGFLLAFVGLVLIVVWCVMKLVNRRAWKLWNRP